MVCKETPAVPKGIYDALDGSDQSIWKEAIFHQYDENQAIQLYATPVPIESIQKETKIIPSIIVYIVKDNGDGQHTFNL